MILGYSVTLEGQKNKLFALVRRMDDALRWCTNFVVILPIRMFLMDFPSFRFADSRVRRGVVQESLILGYSVTSEG